MADMDEDSSAARELARIGRVEQLRTYAKYERGDVVTIATHPGAPYKTSKRDFVPPKRRCVLVLDVQTLDLFEFWVVTLFVCCTQRHSDRVLRGCALV